MLLQPKGCIFVGENRAFVQTRTPMRPPLLHDKFISECVCDVMNCPGNFYQTSKHVLACSQAGPDTGPLSYSQDDPSVSMVTNQLGSFQQGHVASWAATGHQGWPNLISRYKEGHWIPTRLGPRHLELRVTRLSQSPGLAAHKDQGLELRAVEPPRVAGVEWSAGRE